MLIIENHGSLILASNFWETDYARNGVLYVSVNAGAFRLLLAPSQEPLLADLRTAREVVISRGPWPEARRDDAIEVLCEDDTDTPFAFQIGMEQIDRAPEDSDAGREWLFSAWTAPRRGRPHKALERPAWFRRVPKIPWLKPRTED